MGLDSTIGGEDRSGLHRQLMAAGLAIGVAVVAGLVGGFLGFVAILLVLTGEPAGGPSTDAGILALTIGAELGYAAVALGYLVLVADGVPLSRPSGRALGAAVLGSVALVALGQGLLRLVPGAGIDDVSRALGRAGVDPAVFVALAVVAVVLIGPAEELLFRGAIQGTLRRAFGPWSAVGGASVLFTGFHASALAGNSAPAAVAALGVIFLVSLVLGYTFERTGSLVLPIVVHSLYDGLLLVAGYLLAAEAIAPG